MPDREKAKVGDVVEARWFNDPRLHSGVVREDQEGLYINIEGDIVGYLKDADEVHLRRVVVNLVVKASKGIVVEGYAFHDSGKADDKADDMRNTREFNEAEDDVCVIYDVEIE